MKNVQWAIGMTLLSASLLVLAGCKSNQDKALEQAKNAAAATNTAQQVQYVDKDGNTVTTVVQPPVAGQAPQITTQSTPPPVGTKPAETKPVIVPVNQVGSLATVPAPVEQVAPASASTGPAVAPAPVAAMKPVSLTIPAGTTLAIRINERIDVKHTPAGSHFSGEFAEPVVLNGVTAVPQGTAVRGRVDASHKRGHFKGASILELRLTSMTLNGNEYALDTHDNVHTKKGKGKRSAGWIGGMTGAGMLIGGIATGGVGLAIGAASGAGAGTLIAGTTGNKDIVIPAESVQRFRLADALTIQH